MVERRSARFISPPLVVFFLAWSDVVVVVLVFLVADAGAVLEEPSILKWIFLNYSK
jgi:hypothetical protein